MTKGIRQVEDTEQPKLIHRMSTRKNVNPNQPAEKRYYERFLTSLNFSRDDKMVVVSFQNSPLESYVFTYDL